MNVSIENTGGLRRRISVEVPNERVEKEVKKKLGEIAKTAKLDGFRPGKFLSM